MIEELLEIEAEKKEHERKARTIAKQANMLREKMAANVEANNGKPINKGKYQLRFDQKQCSVSWKNEFVRVASVDEANELTSSAPMKNVLVVS